MSLLFEYHQRTDMGSAKLIIELEQIFDILNQGLFGGELESVNFTIQLKKKVSLRWIPDIERMVIGADFSKLELGDIPAVMLHEMIHISNHQKGLLDVTANQYHNKHFLKAAMDVGFVVIKHKTQGWAITSTIYPRNVVQHIYIKHPNKDAIRRRNDSFKSIAMNSGVFKAGLADLRDRIKIEKPTKTYFLKYQCNCPPPHNSIRSGRRPDGPNALNIQCMNCRTQFECITVLDEN